MISRIRIGADLQQHADKRQRTVINSVFGTRVDRQRPDRNAGWIIDSSPQSGKTTRAKSGVDLIELLVFCASGHGYQAQIVDAELNLAESDKELEQVVKVRLLFVRGTMDGEKTTTGKHD